MHVFTYGTLMFPEVWQTVVGRLFETVEGTISGYKILRVKDAVFPGIAAASDTKAVRGVVYLDVNASSVARLDKFEDDFYQRKTLSVDCDDGRQRAAEAYVVPPTNFHVLTDEPWLRETFVTSGGLEHFINRFAGFGRVADDH
jgi:gamma-glutamylcyclotransferase (GGCT)/AIG2-like uncharacterized protein YtfP